MLKWLLSLFGVKTPVDTTDSLLSQKKDQLDTLKELTAAAVAPKVYQNTPVQNKKADPVKVVTKLPPKAAQFKTESPVKYVDDVPVYVAPVYVPTPTYDSTDYSSRCSDSYSSSSSSYSSSDSGSSCSSSSFD